MTRNRYRSKLNTGSLDEFTSRKKYYIRADDWHKRTGRANNWIGFTRGRKHNRWRKRTKKTYPIYGYNWRNTTRPNYGRRWKPHKRR